MCSIGILGFVVWSQLMAFLVREDKVINSTVGWNGYLFLFLFIVNYNSIMYNSSILYYTKSGNLLDTFYSLNSDRNAQSAGNLRTSTYRDDKLGSSETIRGSTYDLFELNFSYYFNERFKKDNIWLSWFIGFAEGDGAILEHKGRCTFVLTQKDDKVLHEVNQVLNIGIVKHFYDKEGNRKYSRWVVSENKGIFLLYLLLNGNLVLESRIKQLTKWNTALNNATRFNFSVFYSNKVPELIETPQNPSIENAWLSGFTDAEGCFSVKIENRKKAFYVQLLFILDQKNGEEVLNSISLMLNANTKSALKTVNKYVKIKKEINSSNTMFRLTLSCNDSKKLITSTILNYFYKYPLKTSKSKSFQAWTLISKLTLGKQPLSSEDIKVVRKLRHNMNFFTVENQKRGHANKS